MKYFAIFDKNVIIFLLQWKIGNISYMFLQYSVLCGLDLLLRKFVANFRHFYIVYFDPSIFYYISKFTHLEFLFLTRLLAVHFLFLIYSFFLYKFPVLNFTSCYLVSKHEGLMLYLL